jgi:hypothetical protein
VARVELNILILAQELLDKEIRDLQEYPQLPDIRRVAVAEQVEQD